jgi:hypothetical protein
MPNTYSGRTLILDLTSSPATPVLPLSDLLNNVLRDTPQKANS